MFSNRQKWRAVYRDSSRLLSTLGWWIQSHGSALLQNLQACIVTWRKLIEKKSAQIPGTCFTQYPSKGVQNFKLQHTWLTLVTSDKEEAQCSQIWNWTVRTLFSHFFLFCCYGSSRSDRPNVICGKKAKEEWVGSGNKKGNVIVDSANEMKGRSGLDRKVTKEAAYSNNDEREIGVKKNVTVRKEKNFNTLNHRFSNRWWKKRQSSNGNKGLDKASSQYNDKCGSTMVHQLPGDYRERREGHTKLGRKGKVHKGS
jgi:hypothetical protein